MKPIWYFVGLILLVIGSLIFLAGLYQIVNPPQIKTVLAEIHPNLWWGIIMIIAGVILYNKNKKEIIS